MLAKLYKSYKKNKSRKLATKEILKAPQRNDGVVNVYRSKAKNVGDYYCAPQLYFPEICNEPLDIFDFHNPSTSKVENFISKVNHNALVIGGGGLLNRGSFERQLKLFEELSEKNKKMVIWGAGHNSKSSAEFGKITSYNIDISKYGLVGTRDDSMPGEFVPCASCMHEIFDKNYEPQHEVGIIFHTKTEKNKSLLNKLAEIPHTFNHTNLEEMINFLGDHKHIITNSYHAMYWGMMMKRKVSVIPNSSKFYDFKYLPNFTTFDDCLDDYKNAQEYSGVLEECRELNINFAKKVKEYLS